MRLRHLDGLRGLAAVAIVVLHVWMYDHGDAGRPPKTSFDHLVGELRLGVPLFFVLSGFLLFRPWVAALREGTRPPDLARYALRRAARIAPAYWLALALSFALLAWLDHPRQVAFEDLGWFLLFLQNQHGETLRQLDPPMWTLGVEVSFYVLLPLLGLLAVRLRRPALLCAAVFAGGAALSVGAHLAAWPDTVLWSLVTQLPVFACGMAVAVFATGRSVAPLTARGLLLAGVALVALNAWWHGYGAGPSELRHAVADLPAAVGFALVVAALTTGSFSGRVLDSRPARTLGDLSYGTYLLHFPVIYLLRGVGEWPADLGAALVAVLAVTTAAAFVCHRLVEAPAMRWARRRAAPRRQRALTPRQPMGPGFARRLISDNAAN